MDKNLYVSDHFKVGEVMCPCGCETLIQDTYFISMLEKARRNAMVPFPIHSWCRCVAHNKAVGGVQDSEHLVGRAADIGYTSLRRGFMILTALLNAGFTRIGIGKDFIHADTSAIKQYGVLWTYSFNAHTKGIPGKGGD